MTYQELLNKWQKDGTYPEELTFICHCVRTGLFIGLTQDHDGFQLAGITYSGQVGFLSIITENNLIDVHGYKRFTSVKDFISFYEGKQKD